jgi:hypothetical protein
MLCPSRSLILSSRDILVTGAGCLHTIIGGGLVVHRRAGRWATTLFRDSRLARFGFFGAPSSAFGVVGLGRGFVSIILSLPPTKPKHFIKGLGCLLFRTTTRPAFLIEC